jgi:hypothetical protein
MVQEKLAPSCRPEREPGRVKSEGRAATMIATFSSADLHFLSMPASGRSSQGLRKGTDSSPSMEGLILRAVTKSGVTDYVS